MKAKSSKLLNYYRYSILSRITPKVHSQRNLHANIKINTNQAGISYPLKHISNNSIFTWIPSPLYKKSLIDNNFTSLSQALHFNILCLCSFGPYALLRFCPINYTFPCFKLILHLFFPTQMFISWINVFAIHSVRCQIVCLKGFIYSI